MHSFSKDHELLENMKLGEGVKGVYISIDVDCLDPSFALGVSHMDSGGLSFRDVMNIVQNIQGDILEADAYTIDGMTTMVATKLVRQPTSKMSKIAD